jgi:hypothetical protein
MRIIAKGIAVKPFLWKFQRRWDYGVETEIDVTPEEFEAIKLDPRISVSPAIEVSPDDQPSQEKRRPGRPRKES